MNSVLEEVAARRRAWVEVVDRGSLDDYADLVTDDVVWLPPSGDPITGRRTFRAWLEPFFAMYDYQFAVEPIEVHPFEGWCAELGHFRSVLSAKSGGDPQEHGGRYFVLWRRDADGRWRIERYVDGVGKRGHERRVASALRWIVEIFDATGARYQAVGGLAARAHGATRPLVDLDFYVRAEDLPTILAAVGGARVWGPEHFQDEHWDLTFAKLERDGVRIELAEAEGARLFDGSAGQWLEQGIAFHDSEVHEVLGVEVRVMPRAQLVAYKRALDRPVDALDLGEIAD